MPSSMRSRWKLCVLRTIGVFAFVVVCSVNALADVNWDLSGVKFKDGATVTGSFTTNGSAVTGFNILLNLPGANPIQAVKAVSSYLPNAIGFSFNTAFTEYVDLVFKDPMKPGQVTINLQGGRNGSVLCPTPGGACSFLTGKAQLLDPPSVPEPASMVLLSTVLGLIAIAYRRRRLQGSSH